MKYDVQLLDPKSDIEVERVTVEAPSETEARTKAIEQMSITPESIKKGEYNMEVTLLDGAPSTAATSQKNGKRTAPSKGAIEDIKKMAQAMAQMTATKGWAKLWAWAQTERQRHALGLESTDADRKDDLGHKFSIRSLDDLKAFVRTPLDNLKAMKDQFPLFTSDIDFEIEFSDKTGVLTLRSVKPASKKK